MNMSSDRNLIGAVLVSFLLLFIVFAGLPGLLFTMSGKTSRMPAYGTRAAPTSWAGQYVDALSYDQKGNVIDFQKIPGKTAEVRSRDSDSCKDQTYVYSIKNMQIWKKGFGIDAVQEALEIQLGSILKTCSVPAGKTLTCAEGCMIDGKDQIDVSKPLDIALSAADAAAPGILQFVLTLNGECIRTMHCSPKDF